MRRALRTRERTMGMIGVAIRRAVVAGRKLLAAKGDVGHGQFMGWLSSHGITGDEPGQVSYASAHRWMGLARFDSRNPAALESCSSITAAYRLAGLLPEPEQPSGGGNGQGGGGVLALVAKSERRIEEEIAARPLEKWSRADLLLLEQRLRKLAELHDRVQAQLGN